MECQTTVLLIVSIYAFLATIAYIHLSIKHRTLIKTAGEGFSRIHALMVLKQVEQTHKDLKDNAKKK